MKQVFLVGLLTGAAYILSAQPDPDQRENKVAAYRVAVFTEVLNLTPEEAQGFWPVYNDYIAKRQDIQRQLKPSRQIDGMNDPEVEDYVKKYFELRNRELDLEKDLNMKLRKVIPLRKIAKIPVAEREFRQSLVKKLGDVRQKRLEKMQQRQDRRNGRF
jgi:vacuolar-type H+-ATPase subunit I/STV1